MFTLDTNQCIRVTRGDSFSVPLFINKGTELTPLRYMLKETDKVYFYLMRPNTTFEKAILTKEFALKDVNDKGDVLISFQPKDTLRIPAGKYYYQIVIHMIDESGNVEINTLSYNHLFYIEV